MAAKGLLTGCDRWKKQYMCPDGVSETLSAPGVVTVNTLRSAVGRKQASDSEKQCVPLLPALKLGVSVSFQLPGTCK